MVILLMGVTGVGKTTVGQALANELHWRFADADDYHPAANIAKMRAGIALDDADRAPWLQSLHDAIVEWLNAGADVVLACSALKNSYRQLLIIDARVQLVYLFGTLEVISRRLGDRVDHYMNPSLLRSQLGTLEEPGDAITVDANQTVQKIVAAIRAALHL